MKPSSLLKCCTITALMRTAHSSLGPRSKIITLGGYEFSAPKPNDRHNGTIIAWPSVSSIANQKGANVHATRQEITNLVKAIAKFEPVEVFVKKPQSSRKANNSDNESASHMLHDIANATLHLTPNVDSLWARDTGPFIVYATPKGNSTVSTSSPQPVGLVMNFNQWGQKDLPTVDSYFAASACNALDRQAVLAPFIAEGGGIEMDGLGTLIATESAILNANRNPGVDQNTMEVYFKKVFGITKVIWLPGTAGADITDDHIDGLARFGPNGVVFLSKPYVPRGGKEEDYLSDYLDAVKRLKGETNALGKSFTLVDIPEPDPSGLGFPNGDIGTGSVSYVNFYAANGAIILAKFGDQAADQNALKIVQTYFPDRTVEQVMLHQIALQGGGIHCSTQEFY